MKKHLPLLLKSIKPLVLTLFLGSTVTAAAADPLMIQGSTTFARRLMEPFQAEIEKVTGHQLTVVPNKSTPGMIALLEGRTHLTMISAPLETEVALLQKTMPGMAFDQLRAFEISRTRIALAINRSNPAKTLKLDQVTAILQGKIDNWKALGGADMPIRVVLVGGGGGVTVAVEGMLLNGQQSTPKNRIYVKTPVQLVQVVEQEPGALGFAQLALVQQRGLPELQTDRPLEQVLYLVSLGEPTKAMRDVIDATRKVAATQM